MEEEDGGDVTGVRVELGEVCVACSPQFVVLFLMQARKVGTRILISGDEVMVVSL